MGFFSSAVSALGPKGPLGEALFGGGGISAPSLPTIQQNLEATLKTLVQLSPQLQQLQQQDIESRLALLQQFGPQAVTELGGLRTQQSLLDIQRISQLAPQLRAAAQEPITADIRAELGRQVQQELLLGAALEPGERREIQQAVRTGQQARGVSFGERPVFEEAITTGAAAAARRRARQQAATQFLQTQASTLISPVSAIQALAQGVPTGLITQPGLGQQLLGGVFSAQQEQSQLAAEQAFNIQSLEQQRQSQLLGGSLGLIGGIIGGIAGLGGTAAAGTAGAASRFGFVNPFAAGSGSIFRPSIETKPVFGPRIFVP